MLLSVVINTYERPESLSRCLEALSRQKGADPFEVIVVDDGSRLDLKAIERLWADRLRFELVRIRHAGRSAARNRGVRSARGERILFLGDDVIVRPGCLARHRRRAEPLVAVVGPYPLRNPTGSPPFRHWAEPNPEPAIEDPEDAGFRFFGTGNLSMSRQTFLELGGFDEQFQHYGWEDLDLGLRLERAGGKLVYDSQARADHIHPPMDRAALWHREREVGYTALQFWRKWEPEAADQVAFMKFWDDPQGFRPGPRWRRRLGDMLIALLYRMAPASGLNGRLYERMVYAWRLEGVAEAWRDFQSKGTNWP